MQEDRRQARSSTWQGAEAQTSGIAEQVTPEKPFTHTQVKPEAEDEQTPPLWQGPDAQELKVFWQAGPLCPTVQAQVKPEAEDEQTPPC
jgi:hypothetical protein